MTVSEEMVERAANAIHREAKLHGNCGGAANCYELARAALTAALSGQVVEPDGWQDIATAPKDGREVLLRVKMRAGIPGGYLIGHYMRGGHCIDDHPPIEQGWYFWNGCMFDKAAEPLLWQPIPAPPPSSPVPGGE